KQVSRLRLDPTAEELVECVVPRAQRGQLLAAAKLDLGITHRLQFQIFITTTSPRAAPLKPQSPTNF
ncbi:MAG: hypothetical protein RBG13Loki_2421, partial [Promethearchaeota archaeon CR_4]